MSHELDLNRDRRQPLTFGRAFIRSLVAVAISGAIAAVIFVPRELARGQSALFVRSCEMLASDQAVLLVKEYSLVGPISQRRCIFLHDLGSNQSAEILDLHPYEPMCIAVHAPTERIFLANEDGSIYVHQPQRPELGTALIGRHVYGFAQQLICSPDGKTLISLGTRGLYAWDLDSWSLRWCDFRQTFGSAVVLADSHSVLCARPEGNEGLLVELDLLTGDTREIVHRGRLTAWRSLTVSPNGRYVVCLSSNSQGMLLSRDPADRTWRSQSITPLITGMAHVDATFSPDSNLLIVGDTEGHQLLCWDVNQELIAFTIGDKDESILGSKFVDQHTLLSWNSDGAIQVWDLQSRLLVQHVVLANLAIVFPFI
ncbi:MAG: WD40 repeat domain-containing protein [Pirellulaceae bacterium]